MTFRKFLSCFMQWLPKIVLTVSKFSRHCFSGVYCHSSNFLPNQRNLFLAIFLLYWAFRNFVISDMWVHYIFDKTCMGPNRVVYIIKNVGDMEWSRWNIICEVTVIKVFIAAIVNFPRLLFGPNRRVAATMILWWSLRPKLTCNVSRKTQRRTGFSTCMGADWALQIF